MLFGNKKADERTEREVTIKQEKERKRTRRYRALSVLLKDCRRSFARVSSCLCPERWRRASLAVETAAVVPIFLMTMLAMISLMEFPALESQHLMRLCESAKMQGLEAMDASEQEQIRAEDSWLYVPIGGLLPLPAVPQSLTVQVHAWSGSDSIGTGESTAEEMVAVTAHGTVYHTDLGCRHLHVDVFSASGSEVPNLRNQEGERYHACEQCSDRQPPGETVYVTPTGSRYHNLASCGSLRRTNCLVPISQVEGFRECLTCQRKHGEE